MQFPNAGGMISDCNCSVPGPYGHWPLELYEWPCSLNIVGSSFKGKMQGVDTVMVDVRRELERKRGQNSCDKINAFVHVWSNEQLMILSHILRHRIHKSDPLLPSLLKMSSEANQARLCWAEIFALRTLHKATLLELLCTQNYAVRQLLHKYNDLQ